MTFLLQQVIRKRNDFLLVEIGMYDVTNERKRERESLESTGISTYGEINFSLIRYYRG